MGFTTQKFSTFFSFFLVVLFVVSCTNPQTEENKKTILQNKEKDDFTPVINHANFFTISNQTAWKQIIVLDPWKLDTLGNYALVHKTDSIPDALPKNVTVVRVPVIDVACLSLTHIGALVLLGHRDNIVGVSNGRQVYDSIVNKRFVDGKIVQVGSQMNTNVEQIINLNPDLLFKTGHDNVRNDDDVIRGAGIPVAYNIEWMEPDLLSRAEWIKYTAAFLCSDRLADSLFREIENSYKQSLQLAKTVSYRPKVLLGVDNKGAWHLAGENSYVAQMIRDAGGTFIPNGNKGSAPLNFEQVLEIYSDNDIWLNWMHQGIESLEVLGKMNERYSLFKAFRNGEVYNHDKRINYAGGNDFWESGVSRPDILMKDLVKMFHPELLPNYETVYWRKLK